jgi:hypothetical protein
MTNEQKIEQPTYLFGKLIMNYFEELRLAGLGQFLIFQEPKKASNHFRTGSYSSDQ